MNAISSNTQWTLGGSSSVGVWINRPQVSSAHCRLSKTKDGYLLEDLGSTNGTFRNGQRISKPEIVFPSDEIYLAGHILMPWPDPQIASSVIKIGHDHSNDLRLDDDSVSSTHAMLIVDHNDQVIVVDCDSSNGTWVGDKRVGSALVSAEDRVQFGMVSLLLDDVIGSRNPKGYRPSRTLLISWVIMFIASIALIWVLSLIVFTRGSSPSTSRTAQDSVSNDNLTAVKDPQHSGHSSQSDTLQAIGTISKAVGVGVPTQAGDSAQEYDPFLANVPVHETKPPELLGLARVRQSLFLVLIHQGDRAMEFTVAWAVSPGRLITNASTMATIKQSGVHATVVHLGSGNESKISKIGLHPEYQTNRKKLIDTLTEIQSLQKSEPSSSEDAERLATQLRQAKERLPWVAREADTYDAAWIDLEDDESMTTPLRIKNSSLVSSQSLRLASPSLLSDMSYAQWDSDQNRSIDFPKLSVTRRVVFLTEDAPLRWKANFVSTSDSYQDYLYFGCPVVDLRGQVVGMYRGPARTRTGNPQEYMEIRQLLPSLDMVSAEVIREMLSITADSISVSPK